MVQYVIQQAHLAAQMNTGDSEDSGALLVTEDQKIMQVFSKLGATDQLSLPYHLTIAVQKLCHLKAVAKLVADKYLQKDYLFLGLSEHLDVALSKLLGERFDALSNWLLGITATPTESNAPTNAGDSTTFATPVTQEEAEQWYHMIQKVSEIFFGSQANTLENRSPEESLKEVFAADFGYVDLLTQMKPQLDLLLPDSIRVRNYCPYVRKLHALYGNLTIRLYQARTRHAHRSKNQGGQTSTTLVVYSELIPEEVVSMQTLSAAEEEVPLPRSLTSELDDRANRDGDAGSSPKEKASSTASGGGEDRPHSLARKQNDIEFLRNMGLELDSGWERYSWERYIEHAIHTRVEAPGVRGLPNINNTCWLNAGLQGICSIDPMIVVLRETDAQADRPHHPELLEAFEQLLEEMNDTASDSLVVPSLPRFRRLFVQRHPNYGGGAHHDVPEFLTHLLDDNLFVVHPELRPLFALETVKKLRCQKCSHIRRIDGCSHIFFPVTIPKPSSYSSVSLQSLLGSTLASEIIDRYLFIPHSVKYDTT